MTVRVALVDDEQVARTYIERMRIWHEGEFSLAFSAASGQELLHRLASQPVDVVLIDVSMPEINGVMLSTILTQRYPEVDMVAISNFDGYDYVRPMMKNGAQDYLLKSRLTENSLLEVLRRLRQQRITSGTCATYDRQRMKAFLSGQGEWPFPLNDSQSVPCFGVMKEWARLDITQRKKLEQSVENLLEEGTDLTIRRNAVSCGEGLFLLLLRFYDWSSMAAIQQETQYLCTFLSDSVNRVYNAHLALEAGPVMSNSTTLPAYILERVNHRQVKTLVVDGLSLTDTQHLIALINEGNTETLCQKLQDILLPLSKGELRTYLFAVRSVVELARSAAREWQVSVPLPPEGNQLFVWVRAMNPATLVKEIQQLFTILKSARKDKSISDYSEPVSAALRFMENNYSHPILLQHIANAAGVNESYLCRLVRKETGATVSECLTHIRIEHAKALLRQGCPIKEVAIEVGYVQYNHFLRIFKQQEGCTIGQWLQKVKIG